MNISLFSCFRRQSVEEQIRKKNEKLKHVHQKTNHLIKKLKSEEKIKKNEKLTKKEWHALRSSSYSEESRDLVEAIYHLWYGKVEETDAIRDGDIAVLKTPFHSIIKVKLKIHPMKLYRTYQNDVQVPRKSHAVMYGYENSSLLLSNFHDSSIWRLKVAKLLDPHSAAYALLLEKQGNKEDVAAYLQDKYEKIEQQLHAVNDEFLDQECLDEEEIPTTEVEKQYQAKYKKYRGLEKKSGAENEGLQLEREELIKLHKKREFGYPKITEQKIGALASAMIKHKHSKKTPRENFDSIHARFFRGAKKNQEWETTCPAFATKATIAALIELDHQLVDEMQEYLKDLSSEEAQSFSEKMQENQDNKELTFIQLPFSKSEKLKRISAPRMIRLLKKKKCVARINPPKMKQFYKSIFR